MKPHYSKRQTHVEKQTRGLFLVMCTLWRSVETGVGVWLSVRNRIWRRKKLVEEIITKYFYNKVFFVRTIANHAAFNFHSCSLSACTKASYLYFNLSSGKPAKYMRCSRILYIYVLDFIIFFSCSHSCILHNGIVFFFFILHALYLFSLLYWSV